MDWGCTQPGMVMRLVLATAVDAGVAPEVATDDGLSIAVAGGVSTCWTTSSSPPVEATTSAPTTPAVLRSATPAAAQSGLMTNAPFVCRLQDNPAGEGIQVGKRCFLWRFLGVGQFGSQVFARTVLSGIAILESTGFTNFKKRETNAPPRLVPATVPSHSWRSRRSTLRCKQATRELLNRCEVT